jgi:hypothetical protein
MARIFLLTATLAGLLEPAAAPSPMSAAHRSSGIAPLAVFFDALDGAGPATGIVQPKPPDPAPVRYEWEFDDPASGIWPVSGASRNKASGYAAAHVFERPGTYRVRLSVTPPGGRTLSYFQVLTVQSPLLPTCYVSSSAGNDQADGLSPETAWKSLDRAVRELKSFRRILLRRGDSFPLNQTVRIDVPGPGLLGAFGKGERPVVRVLTGSGGIRVAADDWRVADLDVAGPGKKDEADAVSLDHARGVRDSLFLRVAARDFRVGLGWTDQPSMYATPHEGNFVVDCSVRNAAVNGMYLGGRRLAVLGNEVSDTETSHLLRVWLAHRAVIAHNRLVRPGGKRHCLKLHGPVHADGRPPTRNVIVSDNLFSGAEWTVTVGPQDGGQDERLSHVILERNRSIAAAGVQVELLLAGTDLTVRNNVFVGTGSGSYYTAVLVRRIGIEPPPQRVRILNNTVYREDPVREFSLCTLNGKDWNDVQVRNNLVATALPAGQTLVQGEGPGLAVDRNVLVPPGGLVQPSEADYRPKTAAAFSGGAPLPEVFEDFRGRPRPREGRVAAGALEP